MALGFQYRFKGVDLLAQVLSFGTSNEWKATCECCNLFVGSMAAVLHEGSW